MDKCPFCGAEKGDNFIKYRCGTLDNDPLPRLPECWRQWALNLQVELEDAKKRLSLWRKFYDGAMIDNYMYDDFKMLQFIGEIEQ